MGVKGLDVYLACLGDGHKYRGRNNVAYIKLPAAVHTLVKVSSRKMYVSNIRLYKIDKDFVFNYGS